MRILIISQYFWPESFSINAIAVFLVEQGHTIDVITGIPNYPHGKFFSGYGLFKNLHQTYEGVNVYRVWIKPRGLKGGDKRLILNYLSFVISASFFVLSRLNQFYDVSFVYGMSPITQVYPALLLRRIKRVPLCLYVGDLWPDTLFSHGVKNKNVKRYLSKTCTNIYTKSDQIIAVNKSFISPIKKYINSKYTPLTYIPQAVDPIYKPVESDGSLRKSLNISDKDFVLMFAGNLGYAQSVETVTKAAMYTQKRTDIQYVFIGDGSYRVECESFCIKQNLTNCHFIGRKLQEEMPKLIAEADVMLVTLKNQSNYNLTLPGRVQSFMACGKPIICCANGETKKVIIESNAGFFCEAENALQLSQQIIECANMEKTRLKEIGETGLQYSKEHYDMQEVFKKIESVIVRTVFE